MSGSELVGRRDTMAIVIAAIALSGTLSGENPLSDRLVRFDRHADKSFGRLRAEWAEQKASLQHLPACPSLQRPGRCACAGPFELSIHSQWLDQLVPKVERPGGCAVPAKLRARDDLGIEPKSAWVPLREIASGRWAEQEWGRAARKSSTFDCSDGVCQQIVLAIEADHLFACSRAQVRDVLGAPQQCEAILLSNPEGAFAKAIVGAEVYKKITIMDGGAAYPRGVLSPTVRVAGLPQAARLIEAVIMALRDPPLTLAVDSKESGGNEARISGVAGARVSSIVKSVRARWEILTVTASLERDSDQSWVVETATTAYVNSTNTLAPQDFTLPNPAEEQAFEDAILNNLRRRVKDLCPAGDWKNDRTLTCVSTKGAR